MAKPEHSMAMLAIIGGIVGARPVHLLHHLPFILENALLIPAVWEGSLPIGGAMPHYGEPARSATGHLRSDPAANGSTRGVRRK